MTMWLKLHVFRWGGGGMVFTLWCCETRNAQWLHDVKCC